MSAGVIFPRVVWEHFASKPRARIAAYMLEALSRLRSKSEPASFGQSVIFAAPEVCADLSEYALIICRACSAMIGIYRIVSDI